METITKFKGKTDIIINGAANGRSVEELLSETLPLEPVSGLILSRLGELSLDDLAIEVGISHSAIYKIREGKIRPQRDVLLAMAFVLKMTVAETQQFLKSGHRAPLTGCDCRDVSIIFGLSTKMSLDEMESLLEKKQFAPLISRK